MCSYLALDKPLAFKLFFLVILMILLMNFGNISTE